MRRWEKCRHTGACRRWNEDAAARSYREQRRNTGHSQSRRCRGQQRRRQGWQHRLEIGSFYRKPSQSAHGTAVHLCSQGRSRLRSSEGRQCNKQLHTRRFATSTTSLGSNIDVGGGKLQTSCHFTSDPTDCIRCELLERSKHSQSESSLRQMHWRTCGNRVSAAQIKLSSGMNAKSWL